jgi:hypothetical protein
MLRPQDIKRIIEIAVEAAIKVKEEGEGTPQDIAKAATEAAEQKVNKLMNEPYDPGIASPLFG